MSRAVRTRTPVRILPPSCVEQRGERVGDRLGTALGHGPTVAVPGGDDGHPDRRRGRPLQRVERVGGDATEQRPRLVGAPHPGRHRGREQRRRAEAEQAERMPRHVRDGPHQVVGQIVEPGGRACEHPPPAPPVGPEAVGGLVDRTPQQPGLPAVEGVGAVDLGPTPAQAVMLQPERRQERRPHAHGMERRAMVVHHAGHGELAAPGAAADVVGGFEHLDVDPVLGEAYGAGEPVGPGPDDHGGGHHTAPALAGGCSTATVATTASAASTARCSSMRAAPGHLQRDRAVRQPRQLVDRIGDLVAARPR